MDTFIQFQFKIRWEGVMRVNRRELLAHAGKAFVTCSALALLSGKPALSASQMRIRGLFETPMEEPFVTQLHLAMVRLAKEDGLDYQHSESVKANDFSRVLRQWCDEGVELIVGDAYGTEKICRRVAKEYPETAFTMGSGEGPTEPNFSTFYGQNYEPAYLAGMLAARLSKSGKIGCVAGIAVPTTYALINAFRAGAKATVPAVHFEVAYIGSFFDPPKAKEATIALAERGVDVVFAERIGVIEAAAERNMIAIGNMTDQSAINPKVVATSVMWDPYPIIKASVDAVKAKSFKPTDYSKLENIASGANYLAPFGAFADRIPADVKVEIEAKTQAIKDGKFTVAYDESETKSD
jgi:basic membrane lipoprotein Med (substrate-binding protein (PBP1-ABC) superfamily)